MKTKDLVVYIDVDDTLIRSFGSKRMPMTSVVNHVQELHRQGVQLYCWSSAGAVYARETAEELGITSCFLTFLPKPHIMVDDQLPSEWKRSAVVHPNEANGKSATDYLEMINSPKN